MNLVLKEMTLEEKLAAMELLWDDLARSPESIESPDWHKDILDEHRLRVAEGKAQFTDWESAKTEIRKKLPWESRSSMKHRSPDEARRNPGPWISFHSIQATGWF
ncbi:MAG: addiction module protein [Candidatus Binatia bacterium]